MKPFKSELSGKTFPSKDKISLTSIKSNILELIKKDYPNLDIDDYISIDELNIYRQKYIENFMTKEMGALDELELMVVKNITDRTTLTDKIEDDQEYITFSQGLSDSIAKFGGSWRFIIAFLSFMFIWILINIYFLGQNSFDPFPFILLNLILSCVAALQAPLIMMSQNRQEEKDRQRGKKDYMINLKSEVEIRMLHEKLDHLIHAQQQQLIEIQQIQIDMLKEIMNKMESKKGIN
ncbi:MAG: DUF1003 domain-containing protein [bacterium]|nr:DUF1003 domain-containing protein [bacterium]